MPISHTRAYSEMSLAVRQACLNCNTLVGYTPELRYGKQTYAGRPPTDKIWVRFTQVAAGEKKRTLSVPPRVTYNGQALIDLFVPTSQKNGAKLAGQVAEILLGAYYARAPNVDFFKVLPFKDMQQEGAWFFSRGSATYQYDTYEGVAQ